MKNYARNLALAAGLLLSSSASALEVELVRKTETPWTLAQENTWTIYGFGVEEHKYTISVFDTDVTRARQNSAQFLDDMTNRIYDVERKEKPALQFTPDAIRRAILKQHPELGNSKLQPKIYNLNLKQTYGSGLMSTT